MTKHRLFRFFAFSSILSFFALFSEESTGRSPYDEYIGYVSDLRSEFAEEMREEFNLHCSGVRGMLHETIERLGMEFTIHHRTTLGEARALTLMLVDRFVKAINANEKIQPFLETRPFSHKQVGITLNFTGINIEYADGTINHVYCASQYGRPINRDFIVYWAEEPRDRWSIEILDESYEEAVQKNAINPIEKPWIHEDTEKEKEIDRLLVDFRKKMIDKHHMECWAVGGEMAGDVEGLGGMFVVVRRTTHEEARALILDIAKNFLETFNSSQKIQPYLAVAPFPPEMLRLRVNFRTRNYNTYRDGTMESVILEGGQLTYFREMLAEERKGLGYVPKPQIYASETYEEALEKAKTMPKPSLFSRWQKAIFNRLW